MKKKIMSIILVLAMMISTLSITNIASASGDEELKVCADGVLKLSTTCKASDEFTFRCDGCGEFGYRYIGRSEISVDGTTLYYSKTYELKFSKSGTYDIEVYLNGVYSMKKRVIVFEKHFYDDGTIVKEPTCTSDGSKEYICYNCQNTKTETMDKLGHLYDEGIVTRKVSCTGSGQMKYTCSRCGNTKTETIDKLGHLYDGYTVDKEPTCTSSGSQSMHCTRCNHKTNSKSINPLGHDYGEWKFISEATIFDGGEYARFCKKCNHAESKYTNKLKASVKLSKTKVKIKHGKKMKLKIKKKHKDDSIIEWKSSNKKIVKVNYETGVIRAIKRGKAKITLVMESGCKTKCTVTVK